MFISLSESISIGPLNLPVWMGAFVLSLAGTVLVLSLASRSYPRLRATTTGVVVNAALVFLGVWKLFPLLEAPGIALGSPLTLLYTPGGVGGAVAGGAAAVLFAVITVMRTHHGRRIVAVRLAAASAAFALIFGVAALLLPLAVRGGVPAGTATSGKETMTAPDFELPLLNGGSLKLSELRGKTVVVNFWASWCPPCRAEIPHLLRFNDRIDPDKVVILAVNQTSSEHSVERVRSFVEQMGMSFPILLDRTNRVFVSYGVRGIPTTFVINPDGSIRARYVGAVNSSRLEAAIR